MSKCALRLLICSLMFAVAHPAWAERLRLYLDADFSVSRQAAEAIDLGIQTALSEAGHAAGGMTFEVVRKDHRANSKRTLANLQAFLNDPQALALFGGAQSPPYLSNQRFINRNGIPLLLPWSAAGPITRAADGQVNWIFRLSVDDTKAGPFLVNRALEKLHCKRTVLLLMDTGWGRTNSSTMQAAFSEAGLGAPPVFMFSAALGAASARSLARSAATVNPDCAIMLASAAKGIVLANELHEHLPGVRLINHWGILTAEFAKYVSHQLRTDMQMEVLQTCGLQVEQEGRAVLARALAAASQSGTGFRSLSDVPSSTGFVHGYDLTKLFLAAVEQAAQSALWKDAEIEVRRDMLRLALEALPGPVDGILKPYAHPFRPYTVADPDAHEALGMADLCVAVFSETGRLVLADRSEPGR